MAYGPNLSRRPRHDSISSWDEFVWLARQRASASAPRSAIVVVALAIIGDEWGAYWPGGMGS